MPLNGRKGGVLVQPDRVRPFRSTTVSSPFSASEMCRTICGRAQLPKTKGKAPPLSRAIPPSCGSPRTLKLAASVVIALAQAIPEFNHQTRFRQYPLVESERRSTVQLVSAFCDSIGCDLPHLLSTQSITVSTYRCDYETIYRCHSNASPLSCTDIVRGSSATRTTFRYLKEINRGDLYDFR